MIALLFLLLFIVLNVLTFGYGLVLCFRAHVLLGLLGLVFPVLPVWSAVIQTITKYNIPNKIVEMFKQ